MTWTVSMKVKCEISGNLFNSSLNLCYANEMIPEK